MSLVLLADPFSRRGTSLQRWLFSVAVGRGSDTALRGGRGGRRSRWEDKAFRFD